MQSKTAGDDWTAEQIADGELHRHRIVKRYLDEQNEFQNIEIVETESYGKGLFLDGRVQHVERDEYIYSEIMVHPALIMLGGENRRVLVVGGGPGGVIRESLKHRSVNSVVQVEIDEHIINFSRKHFAHISQGCWDDSRVTLVIDDICAFASDARDNFDLIIFDVSEPIAGTPAENLFGQQMLRTLKNLLSTDGIFVTWAGSASPVAADLAKGIFKNVNDVFEFVAPALCHMHSYGTSWLTLLASRNRLAPLSFERKLIDQRIRQQVNLPIRFYDGETHQHVFHLTKDTREIVNSGSLTQNESINATPTLRIKQNIEEYKNESKAG